MSEASTRQDIITTAIEQAAEMNPQETDGEWLEVVTVESAPYIKEWDIAECWHWREWPDRQHYFKETTKQDPGIDAVARRRSDGRYIAIQCKSRKLDEAGCGASIKDDEIAKFGLASADEFWAERWLVTNGDTPLSSGAANALAIHGKPLKLVNITNDLHQQQQANAATNTVSEGDDGLRSKSTMQDEAVAKSVRILQSQARSESGGLPVGEARGRIILPCGTGKTRISLRIIEALTPERGLSIVLCPSIALVAQIRREYLQHASVSLDVLAVCSDESAGYDPKKEGSRNATLDPTVDNSNVSASDVKGKVTTDAGEIANWMREGAFGKSIKVLIGTYQSSAKVSEALLDAGIRASVMIADEAHRTAGLKRKNSKSAAANKEEQRLRDFTVCHDNSKFPVTYRVYQTATPRIYDVKRPTGNPNWIVRSMDDEETFGVELYRKSYQEAVQSRWLSDYRIIALGINDPDAYKTANDLAKATKSTGRGQLTTTDYLRGLAFALTMGGATQGDEVDIKSCIAFMNTVDKSKNMAADLQSDHVKQWISRWLSENADGRRVSDFSLEHLDASSNAAARETAKGRLAAADTAHPHGIINVGIFGEGTDSPSLSAVAFLEARKSPIDVVQAVGRAMRTAPGKELGYIVCPVVIPPTADPEKWLSTSAPEEGWKELGQILLALRAHDQRIEENLGELLQLYIPNPPPVERTLVAIAAGEGRRIQYGEVQGPPGAAQHAVEQALAGKSRFEAGIARLNEQPDSQEDDGSESGVFVIGEQPAEYEAPKVEMTQILIGKKHSDGSVELRADSVVRDAALAGEARGIVNIQKTRARARKMINTGEGGIRVRPGSARTPRKTAKERAEEQGQLMLKLSGLEEYGNAIKMNLLSKSGLSGNRVMRDLNILESSITEAAHHMRADGLLPALNTHFGLDRLKETGSKQADGCTIAALLMMNAAMLHQRISNGGWLSGISDLALIKNEADVARKLGREWERIMRHDFRPVLEPALEAIYAVETTGKTAGLERALHHLAAEAERIAETYADMGADHAGPLFNRVMGNQASDGAFFTRPVAASLAARLTLDACGEQDWSDPEVWRRHKTVDLACGSGTLLAAMLSDMKRRAREKGADAETLNQLQKLAVEDVIKGLDINPVSLQLAASQLTAGNQRVSYKRMGLHLMPYGPNKYAPDRVHAGTLELLGQRAIVSRTHELDLDEDAIDSEATWEGADDAELEDAVDAVKDARIVIMNPPFTNREKMGEKFSDALRAQLRVRVDGLESALVQNDLELEGFVSKNSIGPLFEALAEKSASSSSGAVAMIWPTVAFTGPSTEYKRQVFARRFHIHTLVTCHQPGNINLSQNTSINESLIVARRSLGAWLPTRIVSLDRMPTDDQEIAELHGHLARCDTGLLPDGWGEISEWSAKRIEAGDWTAGVFRSPQLAEAAYEFANHEMLVRMEEQSLVPSAVLSGGGRMNVFQLAESDSPGSFPVLYSKSAEAQPTIRGDPDQHWAPKNDVPRHDWVEGAGVNRPQHPLTAERIVPHASHLLVTSGQRTGTGRLTAVVQQDLCVGVGWLPVPGVTLQQAKASAIFLNSTAGRLQLLRNPGRGLEFPLYRPAGLKTIRLPDLSNNDIVDKLAQCWEATADMIVPQYRDGECEVRRLWDEAVAEALGWDAAELARLRMLLHKEPHVRGLGYGQYADEAEIAPADRRRFTELADRWERDTVFMSNSSRAVKHPAHREIISMGESVVPLLMERIQENLDGKREAGGHWFYALHSITGANPVKHSERGNIQAVEEAWLEWGARNGYG
ncbi:MAG: DEAD/DEAH box helicase family protein [Gammaproteobacteria bacterium]|nr:DEAD/DEAH box helicase family protein [Gammaproteobacteria bacterium]